MSLERVYQGETWSLTENGETILTVKETGEKNEICLKVTGSLRSDTEHWFQDELVALSTMGIDIVVDCEKLEYIANACQIALLSVQKRIDKMGRGSLTLRNVPDRIYDDFKKTNLHELLMIE